MDDFRSAIGVDLHLDPNAGEGRRSGLERALRDAVRDGRLAPGARLPATRRLADELGISRGTAKAATGGGIRNAPGTGVPRGAGGLGRVLDGVR